jgi:Ni,Fe-hydrogenase I small subunit
MSTLLWLQGSCCGGETVSLLNAEQPDFLTTLENLGYDLIWHPSFSFPKEIGMNEVVGKMLSGKSRLGVLVVEGAIYNRPEAGPQLLGPKARHLKDLVIELAAVADYTLAVGTCASFSGMVSCGANPFDATGLQFFRRESGGLLGKEYRSKAGFPVINIPGCPAHPDWITIALASVAGGKFKIDELDAYNRPKVFYSKLAHHACPRNEYYEFKASAEHYSQQGCLFENLGCKGTLCESDCNERLWLSRSGSCPRGGFPCLSCTSPDFPDGFVPFFQTAKIGNIPTTLPRDVPKAWYVGISGLAKLACPERVKKNAVSHKLEEI